MRHTLLACTAVFVLTGPLAAADEKPAKPKLALRVGKIITSAGDPIVNGTILIADGKITGIGTRDKVAIPDGYTVIDHGDKFAMPGLIDAHSHVGGTGRDGSGDINEMVYQ